jgi:hypothetical protein
MSTRGKDAREGRLSRDAGARVAFRRGGNPDLNELAAGESRARSDSDGTVDLGRIGQPCCEDTLLAKLRERVPSARVRT